MYEGVGFKFEETTQEDSGKYKTFSQRATEVYQVYEQHLETVNEKAKRRRLSFSETEVLNSDEEGGEEQDAPNLPDPSTIKADVNAGSPPDTGGASASGQTAAMDTTSNPDVPATEAPAAAGDGIQDVK